VGRWAVGVRLVVLANALLAAGELYKPVKKMKNVELVAL